MRFIHFGLYWSSGQPYKVLSYNRGNGVALGKMSAKPFKRENYGNNLV